MNLKYLMSLVILLSPSFVFAQEVAAKGPSTLEMFIMPVGFLVIFYFLILRPQQKKAKDLSTLVQSLKVGDEVVTTGGLLGRVKSISETFVTLDLGPQTTAKVVKSCITGQTKDAK